MVRFIESSEQLLHREAVATSRETVGSRHPDTLGSISNLGQLLRAKGDLAAAELLFREVLEVRRETIGSRHPHTLSSMTNLLEVRREVGREALGDRHPSTLVSVNTLTSATRKLLRFLPRRQSIVPRLPNR